MQAGLFKRKSWFVGMEKLEYDSMRSKHSGKFDRELTHNSYWAYPIIWTEYNNEFNKDAHAWVPGI